MHRITQAIRTSMAALLGDDTPAEPAASDIQRTNAIRADMLKSLGAQGASRYGGLCYRIEWAADAEGLWYLRSEMMMALCELHGEAEAHKRMTAITELFLGIVKAASASKRKGPPSLRSR